MAKIKTNVKSIYEARLRLCKSTEMQWHAVVFNQDPYFCSARTLKKKKIGFRSDFKTLFPFWTVGMTEESKSHGLARESSLRAWSGELLAAAACIALHAVGSFGCGSGVPCISYPQ